MKKTIIAASAATAILFAGCGTERAAEPEPTAPTTTEKVTTTTERPTTTKKPTTTVAPFDVPVPEDFLVIVHETSRKCFGSAGCNVDFFLEIGWTKNFDPMKSYIVKFDIVGSEYPFTDSFEVQGDTYTLQDEFFASTEGDFPLTVSIVEILEGR